MTQLANSTSSEWLTGALDRIRAITLSQSRITADDLRAYYEKHNLAQPRHPNQWGVAFRVAEQSGLLEWTAQSIISKRPEAKGRRVAVWGVN